MDAAFVLKIFDAFEEVLMTYITLDEVFGTALDEVFDTELQCLEENKVGKQDEDPDCGCLSLA